MTLLEYADQTDESLAALAKRIGMHRGHLHKIARGQRGWNSETADLIEAGTEGRVTPNDLARARRDYLRRLADCDARAEASA